MAGTSVPGRGLACANTMTDQVTMLTAHIVNRSFIEDPLKAPSSSEPKGKIGRNAESIYVSQRLRSRNQRSRPRRRYGLNPLHSLFQSGGRRRKGETDKLLAHRAERLSGNTCHPGFLQHDAADFLGGHSGS